MQQKSTNQNLFVETSVAVTNYSIFYESQTIMPYNHTAHDCVTHSLLDWQSGCCLSIFLRKVGRGGRLLASCNYWFLYKKSLNTTKNNFRVSPPLVKKYSIINNPLDKPFEILLLIGWTKVCCPLRKIKSNNNINNKKVTKQTFL